MNNETKQEKETVHSPVVEIISLPNASPYPQTLEFDPKALIIAVEKIQSPGFFFPPLNIYQLHYFNSSMQWTWTVLGKTGYGLKCPLSAATLDVAIEHKLETCTVLQFLDIYSFCDWMKRDGWMDLKPADSPE